MYSSLLYGTKSFLLEKLKYNGASLNEGQIDVMVDGRPPPISGDIFIAVHPGGFRGTSMEILDVNCQVNITVTLRTTQVPYDRTGIFSIVDQKLGLGPLTQLIIEYIHMNYIILQYAGKYINEVSGLCNQWIEPLRLNICSPPRFVGGEWFHAEGEAREEAIIQTISFADARRVQYTTFQPVVDVLDGYVPPGIVEGETVSVFQP